MLRRTGTLQGALLGSGFAAADVWSPLLTLGFCHTNVARFGSATTEPCACSYSSGDSGSEPKENVAASEASPRGLTPPILRRSVYPKEPFLSNVPDHFVGDVPKSTLTWSDVCKHPVFRQMYPLEERLRFVRSYQDPDTPIYRGHDGGGGVGTEADSSLVDPRRRTGKRSRIQVSENGCQETTWSKHGCDRKRVPESNSRNKPSPVEAARFDNMDDNEEESAENDKVNEELDFIEAWVERDDDDDHGEDTGAKLVLYFDPNDLGTVPQNEVEAQCFQTQEEVVYGYWTVCPGG